MPTELSGLPICSSEFVYCDRFFQIDFGDGGGSADNDTTAGFESGGIVVEEGDIDWGIVTVESPGESGNEV
jgi:hypothetical protein